MSPKCAVFLPSSIAQTASQHSRKTLHSSNRNHRQKRVLSIFPFYDPVSIHSHPPNAIPTTHLSFHAQRSPLVVSHHTLPTILPLPPLRRYLTPEFRSKLVRQSANAYEKMLGEECSSPSHLINPKMGLLKNGSIQDWDDAAQARAYSRRWAATLILVHKHGVLQFINVYKKYMNRCCDELRWGDEVGAVHWLHSRSSATSLCLTTSTRRSESCRKHPLSLTSLVLQN